jgi:5-carboxymethyl-2-hydroxymuconate isomerase
MKDKSDPSVPDLFELVVHYSLLAAGVVPLGHVRVAVGALRGWFYLDVGHAAATLEFIMGIAEMYTFQIL